MQFLIFSFFFLQLKGLGFLTSLNYSGLDRQRTLSNASQGSNGAGDGSPSGRAALGAIGQLIIIN